MKEYLNYIKRLGRQLIREGEDWLKGKAFKDRYPHWANHQKGKDFFEIMYEEAYKGKLTKEEYIKREENLNKINKYKYYKCETGRMFVIDNDVSQALYHTDNDIHERHLPFDNFFINCSFEIENGSRVEGIQIFRIPIGDILIAFWNKREDGGSANMQFPLFEDITGKEIKGDNKNSWQNHINNIDPSLVGQQEGKGYSAFYSKLIRTYVCNFLDFLNNPEVELVKVNRTKEQNLKRIKKGKHPIPKQLFIKVNGKLKITLNKLREGSNSELSHRFWVRGHFRTLRSDSWKNPGTKIWIPPYIKGKGILVDKIYKAVKNKTLL